jgi:hypothetical protein
MREEVVAGVRRKRVLSTPCAFTAAFLSVGATTIRPSVDDRRLDVSHPIQVPSARVGAYTLTLELTA